MIQGHLLKKYREENNLTIKDLSKLMHISKNIIMLWEDGSKIPREGDITFLCSLYGIDRIDLMQTEEKKKKPTKLKFNSTKFRNIIVSIILSVLILIPSLIFESIPFGLTLIFAILVMYNSLYYLKDERANSKGQSGPKTIFGISIPYKSKTTLVKYYILESLIISSLYLILSLLVYLFHIEPLIISLKILENETFNMLFIWLSSFVALAGLILSIEIIFASILMKKEGRINNGF